MYVKYFVISKRGSIGTYVGHSWAAADPAREEAAKLAAEHPDCRFYVVEAFEYVEVIPKWEPAVDFVQLEVP